jgi:hypothetical protein
VDELHAEYISYVTAYLDLHSSLVCAVFEQGDFKLRAGGKHTVVRFRCNADPHPAGTDEFYPADKASLGIERLHVARQFESGELASLASGLIVGCHCYLPITSLAMVESCMFDVPS